MKVSKVKKPSEEVLAKVRALQGQAGNVAVIEPESGRFFVDKNLTYAMRTARKECPGKTFYCIRVGSDFLYEHKGVICKSKTTGRSKRTLSKRKGVVKSI